MKRKRVSPHFTAAFAQRWVAAWGLGDLLRYSGHGYYWYWYGLPLPVHVSFALPNDDDSYHSATAAYEDLASALNYLHALLPVTPPSRVAFANGLFTHGSARFRQSMLAGAVCEGPVRCREVVLPTWIGYCWGWWCYRDSSDAYRLVTAREYRAILDNYWTYGTRDQF